MLNDGFAKIFPVWPLTINKKIKPKGHSVAGGHLILSPLRIASGLNIFIPVGMTIIIRTDII